MASRFTGTDLWLPLQEVVSSQKDFFIEVVLNSGIVRQIWPFLLHSKGNYRRGRYIHFYFLFHRPAIVPQLLTHYDVFYLARTILILSCRFNSLT